MTRARILAIVVVCLAAIATLTALGAWQVERLFWKRDLVATIDARINAEPIPVADVAKRVGAGEDIDYVPTRATGRFLHSGERYFLATREGVAGWHVLTPFALDNASAVVFVNRGFVPYERKDPATRAAGNTDGEVTLTGLARETPKEKPNSFVPDNDPARNAFFWRNIADMAQGLTLPAGATLLPFIIDADEGVANADAPIGGTTVIEIPNNHLQYAITWFSLDLALVVILLVFLVSLWRGRRQAAQG